MSPEDATREALRARVLAVAGGAAVRFEEIDRMDEPGRPCFFRVWVGPPGAAKLYGGRTLATAVERAERALKGPQS